MTVSNLQDDLKSAQLEKQELRVSTLRLLLSEIHNLEIQKGSELSDTDVISVIQREAKKRKEAIEAFKIGGREEQAQKEEAELKILEEYLPAQLSNEELTEIINQVISEALTNKDMGAIMKIVMEKVAGRADGGTVSNLVRQKLL